MSDICMCDNKQCPQFQSCYRAQAKPNEYAQSYAEFKPDTVGRCEHYWDVDTMFRTIIRGGRNNHS